MNEQHYEIAATREVFKRCWAMFNAVKKDQSDTGWENLVNEANAIKKSHNEELYERIILAIVGEAEYESKLAEDDKKDAYRRAKKSFDEAWTLFKNMYQCHDKEALIEEYRNSNQSVFSFKLSSAIYAAFCDMEPDVSFITIAYPFIERFNNGIADVEKNTAYDMVENIIKLYPEHMCKMLKLYSDLRRKAVLV